MTTIEDARALVAELREIHARSRENAREQGWGLPPEDEDHSPWSRAADMIERLTADLALYQDHAGLTFPRPLKFEPPTDAMVETAWRTYHGVAPDTFVMGHWIGKARKRMRAALEAAERAR